MTREEATITLKEHKIMFQHDFGWDITTIKALAMAISALSENKGDLISRQAVINAIANTCFWLSADNWEELTKCINSIPSAENKGTWRHYEGMLYCSECGAEFYDEIMEYTGDEVPKHCPDCGADMRGKADV